MVGSFSLFSAVLLLSIYIFCKKRGLRQSALRRNLFFAAAVIFAWLLTFAAYFKMNKVENFLSAQTIFLSIYTSLALLAYFVVLRLPEKIKKWAPLTLLIVFSFLLLTSSYQIYNITLYLPDHLCSPKYLKTSYNPIKTEWQDFFSINPSCK